MANIIAKSGKAVEVAGDIDTLLLDKTGTITIGNRRATQFVPLGGVVAARAWRGWPALASMADHDARGQEHRRAGPRSRRPSTARPRAGARFVEFTAQTRMSGIDLPDGRAHPQGRARHRRPVRPASRAARSPTATRSRSTRSPRRGATPLLVCRGQPDRRRGRAGGHPQAGHPRALRAAAPDGPARR